VRYVRTNQAAAGREGAMSVRIGLGLANFPFSGAKAFWRWVQRCEDGDVDSLWQTDRLISRQPILESMATMAALAGGTERVKFGMNVVVVGHRDPLVLANECATIDVLSGRRLLPAFGVGRDTAPEWAAVGRDPSTRGAAADEALTLLARLWSEDEVTFHGKHYQYDAVSIAPRPVQQPLPLWIGGSSRAAIRRTANLGTGWVSGVQSPAQVGPVVAAIKRAAEEAGRRIDPDHYGAGFPFRFGSWDDPLVERTAAALAGRPDAGDPREYLAVGDEQDVIARLNDYLDAGASKFILRPIAEGDDDFLYQTERLIETVIPQVHGKQ
jgi:probable F420-dependent oxidoreductase